MLECKNVKPAKVQIVQNLGGCKSVKKCDTIAAAAASGGMISAGRNFAKIENQPKSTKKIENQPKPTKKLRTNQNPPKN